MNRNVVIFAVLALAGFYLYQQQQRQQVSALPAPQASNPLGGSQTAGGQDLYNNILGAISSVAGAVTTIVAQQNTKST